MSPGESDSTVPSPADWRSRCADLIGILTVEVAGFDVPVELTAAHLEQIYLPLLALLCNQSARQDTRVLAGLAGIPAGGKSTFAAVLQAIADRVLPPGECRIVGMDGWHLPNAELDARTTRGASGRPIPLRERKGGPESYDVDAMAHALTRLHDADTSIQLPVYDRRLHEPRPDALLITPATRIVIVEGNYVLGGVEGVEAWDTIAAQLSPRLFIHCGVDSARERMIARHMRGGLPRDPAISKYETNDRLNTQVILRTESRADYQIFAFLDTKPGVLVWPPF